MSSIEEPVEFRIAVVMAGGVSLAIWMGGVAGELLRLVEKPEDFGIDSRRYRPVIDIIAGTSAGGLNGALLGAALAWGVSSERFIGDVRRTWIDLAGIDNMLRSPFDADPPSLLDGDGVFEEALREVLGDWEANKRTRIPDHPTPRVTLTTTLLEAADDVHYDSLGQVLIEPRHTAKMVFTDKEFKTPGIHQKLARAGRATSAFPVAFEPAFLHGSSSETMDMSGILRGLPENGKWAMDGGVLVNRPLAFVLDDIRRRPVDGRYQRIVAYVVPDPKTPSGGPSSSGNGSNPWQDEANVPSMTAVMGRVVQSVMTESLAEDLERWRQMNLDARQQRDLRLSFGELSPTARLEMVEMFYPIFLDQQARISANNAIRHLMTHADRDTMTNWQELADVLSFGRRSEGWQPDRFPTSPPLRRRGLRWNWGFSALRYVAETMQWIVVQTDGPGAGDTEKRTACLKAVDMVVDTLEMFRPISRQFWTAKIDSMETVDGENRRARRDRLYQWARQAYIDWPNIDRSSAPKGYDRNVERFFESVRASTPNLTYDELEPVFSDGFEVWDVEQDHYRYALTMLAERLGATFSAWYATTDIAASDDVGGDAGRSTQAGAPDINEARQAKKTLRRSRLRQLARAVMASPPRKKPHRPDLVPVWNLIQLWILVTRTNQTALSGEPVDLFQISANHITLSADIGPMPTKASRAVGKVTGRQLTHFGAFYKRSWRANDWMWGRLDGSEHLLRMVREATDHHTPDSDQHRVRQFDIAVDELPIVASEVARAEAEAGRGSEHHRFVQAVPETFPSHDREPVIRRALAECQVGREVLGGEIGTDNFAVSATKALAVVTTALKGDKSGLAWFKHVFAQLRNLVVLPIYALALTLRSGSTSLASQVLVLTAMAVAAGTLIIQFGFGIDLPLVMTAASFTVIGAVGMFSMTRLGRLRTVGAAAAVLIPLLLGLAFLFQWTVGQDLAEQVTITCNSAPTPTLTADGTYVLGPDCAVADDPDLGDRRSDRVRRVRATFVVTVVLALIGLAGLAWAAVGAVRHAVAFNGVIRRSSSGRRSVGPWSMRGRPTDAMSALIAMSLLAAVVTGVVAAVELWQRPDYDGWISRRAADATDQAQLILVVSLIVVVSVGALASLWRRRPHSADHAVVQHLSVACPAGDAVFAAGGHDTDRLAAAVAAEWFSDDRVLIEPMRWTSGPPTTNGPFWRAVLERFASDVIVPADWDGDPEIADLVAFARRRGKHIYAIDPNPDAQRPVRVL